MYVCKYMSMMVYMCTSICQYWYVCVQVYIGVDVYVCTSMCQVCMFVCKCAYMYQLVCVCVSVICK